MEQVIQTSGPLKVHSHCEICVSSIAQKDEASYSCVVCWITWHELPPRILPSWDLLETNKAARLSRPAEEIPEKVAEILNSLRTPKSIHKWLQEFSGHKPPAFYWISMLAAYWAGERSSAIDAIEQYIEKTTTGSELHNKGVAMKSFLETNK